MRIVIAVLLSFLFSNAGLAQYEKVLPPVQKEGFQEKCGKPSGAITTSLYKDLKHQATGEKWGISVKNRFYREHLAPDVMEVKRAKQLSRDLGNPVPPAPPEPQSIITPVIGVDFEANWSIYGTPPDNSMAVSNGGFIVTANNDGIEYYTTSGTYLYFDYWYDFFNDPSLTATIYDPKVIYDSGSDRFILVLLHGSTSSSSKVLVCFSQSNDPQDGWWIYTLTGNPLNNSCWFDYPAVGVSNNEVYITGNLFTNAGGFNQALIYQIEKNNGYNGANINWQYWSGLDSNPFEAFTLSPASYGQQGNYGPGIYLVSSRAGGSNSIRLWDLTDDMSGSPQLNSYTVSTNTYGPSADANQLGTSDLLDNGDCRVLSSFYLNGLLHFVFHSDVGSGWNGINYNRLNVATLSNQSATTGNPGNYDFSYPSVASFATSSTDKNVMIGYLSSSPNAYPQVKVINCDNNMNWSSATMVKTGDTYINMIQGDERWGDYTGICRKHNSPSARVWLAGCYGSNITNQGINNVYKTWIAEISGNTVTEVEEENNVDAARIFPNPVYDFFTLEFDAPQREVLLVELFDQSGKQVKTLYNDIVKQGKNRLAFNKGALAAGTYFVSLRTQSQTLRYEKIIVLD